ncbi:MAG TPA: CHASE domain-containing protein [Cytophagales bacterium]|nr:CHASE domain-containing protein [Cytophagales bacterium]
MNFLTRYNLTGGLLALLVLLFTLYIFFQTRREIQEREARRFEYRVNLASTAIKNRMQDYLQILKGAKGLILASDSTSRDEWQRYYQSLNIPENYPGVLGIGLASYLTRGQENKFVEAVRKEGFKNFTISPAGNRDIYTPIVFLEPFEGRNLRAFGYDMFSEPRRRKAMETARDKNQAIISAKVRLVQETNKDVQAGFLLYLPIYKKNNSPDTQEERRKNIMGFAYSPFRAGDLMTAVLARYTDIDIEIYDGDSITKESILYNKDTILHYFSNKTTEHSRLINLLIGGRTWKVYFSSLPSFDYSTYNLPNLILLSGVIISILIFLTIFSFSSSQQSNYVKQLITDNATAALFTLNSKGYCTFLNPAAIIMTGYTFEEIKQRPFHDLIHHSYPSGKEFPLSECPIHSAVVNIKEIRNHEDVFFRKDGSMLSVLCSASPIYQYGRPISTLMEVRDISVEKKSKQELIDTANQLQIINNDLDNFIYTASHDLKAPIANLEGLMNGLNKTVIAKFNDNENKLFDMVNLSINRLKRTIADLTEITKAQKDIDKERERISFKEILEDIKADLNLLIIESNPVFREDLEVENIHYVKKDLRSVLYNLVSNSLKYRSPQRQLEINIKTYREENFTILEIKDNGLGIKQEYQNKLFKMFKRIHNHVEGSGIGLYILKRILENKGGKIDVYSKEEEGTSFKVYFHTF